MIIFLIAEISIILSGLIIILGHIAFADKFLIGTFFIISLAVLIYLIQLIKNENK